MGNSHNAKIGTVKNQFFVNISIMDCNFFILASTHQWLYEYVK